MAEEHDSWVESIFSVKPSAYVASAGDNAGSGEPPVSSAATDNVASSDSSALDHFLTDAGSVVAGAAVHAVAGAVPFGFVGAGATDAVVAAKGTPEQKYWYGLGSTAAGVFDMAAGAAEIVGGIGGAVFTGGASLAVSAEGVNEMVAGAEAISAGTVLMSQGNPGGSGGSGGGAPPDFEQPISKVAADVGGAESEVAQVEASLAEEKSAMQDAESIVDAIEDQRRAGKFDPDIAALEKKAQDDVNLVRRAGTNMKDVGKIEEKVNGIEARRQGIAKDVEVASDVDRTLPTERADRYQRSLSGLSGRLSTLTSRLGAAKDEAIALQAEAERLAARLKKL